MFDIKVYCSFELVFVQQVFKLQNDLAFAPVQIIRHIENVDHYDDISEKTDDLTHQAFDIVNFMLLHKDFGIN